MNVVVRNVARHDQADRRDMQASRIPGSASAPDAKLAVATSPRISARLRSVACETRTWLD